MSLPPSLVEAARVDGASSATILLRVLLPLARPSLIAELLRGAMKA